MTGTASTTKGPGDDTSTDDGAAPDDVWRAAMTARRHAYAPYSRFDAGAAVRSVDGVLHTGVIVENISLGLAMCAERVALFATVAAGGTPAELAVAAPPTAGGRTWPCGACLQVALELGGPDLRVVAGGPAGDPAPAPAGGRRPQGP
ncbi:MAG: cytidine deaminase, partial [Actinomycetota bacterium]|nr:cytidine deaminase [Actinomycetota bacterium]